MYAKEQLKKIEEMVNEDCANGRNLQKKLRQKMASIGQCPQSLIKELQQNKVNIRSK